MPSYLGEGRSCSLFCKEKGQLTILQEEGAAPYFSDGRSSSPMLQKEGAMARNEARISNTFCLYGKSGSVHMPYSRTFLNNGDRFHSEMRK